MSPLESPLCPTCRFNELRRYILVKTWAESRGCEKQIASFPEAVHCDYFEREPGSD